MKKVNAKTRAYLAGHFDGEGNATFKLKERTNLKRVPFIQVEHTHYNTICIYHELYGGSIYERTRGKNKKIYSWQLRECSDIKKFICDIIPFSVEKRQQLEILLSFCVLRRKMNKKSHLSIGEIILLNNLYEMYLIVRRNGKI